MILKNKKSLKNKLIHTISFQNKLTFYKTKFAFKYKNKNKMYPINLNYKK